MGAKLHVIYIPGLGDDRAAGQQLVVRSWRLWGVRAEAFPMRWADGEPWESKLQRLLARIDALTAEGQKVALVGSSAGASAAINAYAVRKNQLVGCVLIAGKINNAHAIGEQYRRQNPAFVESVVQCEGALAGLTEADRRRILSRYATSDPIVPRQDSYISGAYNQTVPTVGHAVTIGVQLVFGAPGFLRFLRRLAA